MPRYKIAFEDPALLDLEVKGLDGNIFTKTVDLFAAWDVITASDKEPNEKMMWEYIKRYIAAEVGCDMALVSQSNAWEFRKSVIKFGQEVIQTVSKKLEPMPSSQQPTLESPPTT